MNSKKSIFVMVLVMVAAMFVTTAFAEGGRTGAGREKKTDWSFSDKKCKTSHGKDLSAVAELLGIDKAELKEKLKNGEKLYDLLVEAGKLEEFKIMLLEDKKAKLDNLVETGKKTREEADAKYEKYKTEVENWDGTK